MTRTVTPLLGRIETDAYAEELVVVAVSGELISSTTILKLPAVSDCAVIVYCADGCEYRQSKTP
jgi:hypothetical protein